MAENLRFVEIKNIDDDLFLDWLDLYEISFPANEKLLFSTLLKILKAKGKGDTPGMHMVVIQNRTERTVGMALFQLHLDKELATLWYLAINPSERNQGLGSMIYRRIVSDIDPSLYKAVIFEVEIPGDAKASPHAERRIQFYQRNGAYLLQGVHYMQDIGWHQPRTTMHIMVHPLQPITTAQVFNLAKSLFGDLLQQVGPLELVNHS